jgi:uncharacterized iron-regulated membrane protein
MAFARKTLVQKLRSILFWVHLAVGISAGAIILLMSVTGVMLGYERQMIAWIDGKPRVEHPGAARLPLDTLLSRNAIDRSEVASVVVRTAVYEPVTLRFRDRATPPKALDPYTAAVIPTPQGGKGQAFFSGLRRWHRWVGASAAEARATGKAVTGAANLGFLFLVLSGLWLWWPRRWSLAALRRNAIPRADLRGKARDFNWHHAVGFWSAVPLALVVATAVFISYQWPGRLLDRTLGSPEEKAAALAAGRPAVRTPAPTSGAAQAVAERNESGRREATAEGSDSNGREAVALGSQVALESLMAAARAARSDWTQVTMTLAGPTDTAHTLLVASGNTYRPDQRTTLVMDASGAASAPLAVRDYASLSTSRQIRAWVRFGHTGEVFGIAGQTLATLVTAAGALLVWTGIALSVRRLWAWRRRRARARAGIEPEELAEDATEERVLEGAAA